MMTLDIIIDEKTIPVTIPESMVDSAKTFFAKMDADMDSGWQMSRVWVEKPDDVQRCQIVADKLLTAIENENQASIGMMSAYILTRLSSVKAVDIDTEGDMTLTRFEFAK